MIENHSRFEGLCALAASGQVCGNERDELNAHLDDCLACRDRIAELAQVGCDIFVARWSKSKQRRSPKGMDARFRERAVREGIQFTDRRSASSSHAFTGLVAAGLLLALLISLSWKSRVHLVKVSGALSATIAPQAQLQAKQASAQPKRVQTAVQHFRNKTVRGPVRVSDSHKETAIAASDPQLHGAKFNLGSPAMRQSAVRLGSPPAYAEFLRDGSLALSEKRLPALWLGTGTVDLDGLPPEYDRNADASSQRVFRFSATVASLISLDFPLRTEAAGRQGIDRNQ